MEIDTGHKQLSITRMGRNVRVGAPTCCLMLFQLSFGLERQQRKDATAGPIWAASNTEFFDAADAYHVLVSVPEKPFWNSYNQRELLFLLKARRGEFTARQRRHIETLLTAGPPRWEHGEEDDEHYQKRSA